MVDAIIPILIIALAVVFIVFKLNNFRTKIAFFFIVIGVLFALFFAFLITTGESFDFSSVGDVLSKVKVYFLWIKGVIVKVFEFTGKIIGIN